jgi:hypothetical protein
MGAGLETRRLLCSSSYGRSGEQCSAAAGQGFPGDLTGCFGPTMRTWRACGCDGEDVGGGIGAGIQTQ